jgi:hypothetical protein
MLVLVKIMYYDSHFFSSIGYVKQTYCLWLGISACLFENCDCLKSFFFFFLGDLSWYWAIIYVLNFSSSNGWFFRFQTPLGWLFLLYIFHVRGFCLFFLINYYSFCVFFFCRFFTKIEKTVCGSFGYYHRIA